MKLGFVGCGTLFVWPHGHVRVSTPRIPRGSKQERTPEPLVRLNGSLRRAAKRDDLGAVIRMSSAQSRRMPTQHRAYEHVLSVLAAKGLLEESWAIMTDMEHSGLASTVTTYNYLLEASSFHNEVVPPADIIFRQLRMFLNLSLLYSH